MVTEHVNEGARSEGTFADSAQGSLSPTSRHRLVSCPREMMQRVPSRHRHLHLKAVRLPGALVGPSVLGPSQFPSVLRSQGLGDPANEGAPTRRPERDGACFSSDLRKRSLQVGRQPPCVTKSKGSVPRRPGEALSLFSPCAVKRK